MATEFEIICLKNKYGYCKFGKFCKSKHENNECEKEVCEKWNCDKRHPKDCWWFSRFRRCKFSNCAYKHGKSETKERELEKKLSELKTKESELEEKVSELNKEVLLLKCTVENMAKKLEKLPEKEVVTESDIDEKVLEGESNTLEEIIRANSERFHCDKCEFSSRTPRGLKIHDAKTHTKASEYEGKLYTAVKNKETRYYDMTCNICGFTGIMSMWKDQMKDHFKEKHDFVNFEERDYEDYKNLGANLDLMHWSEKKK